MKSLTSSINKAPRSKENVCITKIINENINIFLPSHTGVPARRGEARHCSRVSEFLMSGVAASNN